jgi:hypothetical protein
MEDSRTAPPRPRKPFKVSAVFAPMTVPLLFLAAAVSIPWAYIQRLNQRRQERRFAREMKKAGRLMDWQEFRQTIESGTGTAIGESLSPKGPFRLWWTDEDIPTTSPFKCERKQHIAAITDRELLPFFEWCYARFTNPESGVARLVLVPEEKRTELKQTMTSMRFVSTCSFRSLREKSTLKNSRS